jgi:hypothetical protein
MGTLVFQQEVAQCVRKFREPSPLFSLALNLPVKPLGSDQ